MAENSGIEWTTHTFNPWIGCTKVSAACDHCYAETWDKRFGGLRWGPHAERRRTKTWTQPRKWNREAEGLAERPRVFCASLADVFDNHKSILPEWRADLWALIRETTNLDWLLLTKRPQNIKRFLPADWGNGYPNVWPGTTVEDQAEAERRIPHLLDVRARLHFLSVEPLLGPIDLNEIQKARGKSGEWRHLDALEGTWFQQRADGGWDLDIPTFSIGWVIVGGESGPKHRPSDPEWFRDLRDQCAASGVPFLFKQWSGRNQKEIKAKGRALDGVVHDGYPERTHG